MSNSQNTPNPPSFWTATFLLATMQTHALLRGKRVVFLFIMLAVPLFISIVLKSEGSKPIEEFGIMAPQAFIVFLLPLISLFHGTSSFAEEVDQRTLGYLLLRPIQREQIVLGKFLGAWFTTFFILSCSVISCHIVVAWRGDLNLLSQSPLAMPMLSFLSVVALGAAIYVAFSLLLSLIIKHPIFAGLVYIVIVEFFFPAIPGPISNLAMSTHLQRLLPEDYMSIERMVTQERGITLANVDPWISGGVLFLVLGILASLTLLRFREYDLSFGSTD